MSKTSAGNFFEDFRVGQEIRHATPRTLTEGDAALYIALYGSRFALNSSDAFAQASACRARRSTTCWSSTSCSARRCPTSRSMPSPTSAMPSAASGMPVYPGDTLSAHVEVIGLRENSNRQSGVVWVRSTGTNQQRRDGARLRALGDGAQARRGGAGADAGGAEDCRRRSPPADLVVPAGPRRSPATTSRWPARRYRWEDYAVGRADRPRRRHDPRGGRAHVRDAALPEHRHVHFDAYRGQGHALRPAAGLWRPCDLAGPRAVVQRPGQRLPRRRHQRRQPCRAGFAGDTSMPGRRCWRRRSSPGATDVGALRVRTIAAKDCPCDSWPGKQADGKYHPAVVLDLDYWLLVPRR